MIISQKLLLGLLIQRVIEEAEIPVITFDTYLEDIPTWAYVGTNNTFLGITMANVLKQLQPEGGTFAIITSGGKANLEERTNGFRLEITKDNGREGKGQWYEFAESPVTGVRGDILKVQPIADQNPTAIIYMYQSPMRSVNYTDFIDANRDRGIIFVGSDGSDYQLDYLNRRYVDGLVGQLPYDFGAVSADVLHELSSTGKLTKDFYATNLVSYTLIPLELPDSNLDQNLLGNLVILGYIAFVIIAGTAIACIGWALMYRNELVVRAAQPFFLIMVSVGVLFMGSTLIPLSFDDGGDPFSLDDRERVIRCMAVPWFGFVGFTITFCALFSKTWRVNRLFNEQVRHARITVSEKDVLAPFAVLLTCNVVILICWTVIDPLTYEREEHDGTDYWNRPISTYGACHSDNVQHFLTPLAIVNFAVVAIASWQAYQARDIKSEFSESKYIGLALSSLFQTFLTGVPILVIVRDEPKAFYILLSLMIFLLCMTVELLIFYPKFQMQKYYAGMSEQEQKRVMSSGIRQSSGAFQGPSYDGSQSTNLAMRPTNGAPPAERGQGVLQGDPQSRKPSPIDIDNRQAIVESITQSDENQSQPTTHSLTSSLQHNGPPGAVGPSHTPGGRHAVSSLTMNSSLIKPETIEEDQSRIIKSSTNDADDSAVFST